MRKGTERVADSPHLTRLLTPTSLRRLAGARSFDLGEEYYTDGLVSGLVQDGDTLAAEVHGTQTYRVKLQAVGDRLKHDCSCPFAAEGAFCKHCVAIGLAWLSGAIPSTKSAAVTMDDVRAYLQRQGKEALVSLLVERALDDPDLQTRLFLRVAQAATGGPNLAAFRRAIDRAAKTGDMVEYDDVPDYARGLERVAESLGELLSAGHAGATVELAEYALAKVEKSLNSVDDSNGSVGGVLDHLERLHRDACVLAKPEPVALARRLYEWQMRSGMVFSEALNDYADVLGVRGLAEYRRMAEADWASVPTRGPNQGRLSEYGTPWRLAQVMESLARRTGDVEAVVAVLRRDLSAPYRFLLVAQEYLNAGNESEALRWAERGMGEFPEAQDRRLAEFLVERYRTLGRHDEALSLLWQSVSSSVPCWPTSRRCGNTRSRWGAGTSGVGRPWIFCTNRLRPRRRAPTGSASLGAWTIRNRCESCSGRAVTRMPGGRRRGAAARGTFGWNWPASARRTTRKTL